MMIVTGKFTNHVNKGMVPLTNARTKIMCWE
jgi:hypothetical protein